MNRLPQLRRSPEALDPPPENIDHAIAFDWGALHVTEAAHQSYHFVPLAEGVVKGGLADNSHVSCQPRTDLYIVSPDEFRDRAGVTDKAKPESDPNTASMGGYGAYELKKDGIELWVALEKSADQFRQEVRQQISALAEMHDVTLDHLVDHDDIPLIETIDHEAPQALVHGLTEIAEALAKNSSIEFMRLQKSRRLLNLMTKMGSASIGGAGIIVGANIATSGAVGPYMSGFIVGSLGLQGYLMRKALKIHTEHVNEFERAFKVRSFTYGQRVADDVHSTYCSRHFDEKFAPSDAD